LRPGGLVIEALQTTLLHYLRRDGDAMPFWRMASIPVTELRSRAVAIAELVGSDRWIVTDTDAVAGGGTLPGRTIPSAGLSCSGDLTAVLRRSDRPVIARVHENRTVCDLRTVDPLLDHELAAALSAAALDSGR
jgi:L-seryl-tRNA(Ser) seleniumtransferase